MPNWNTILKSALFIALFFTVAARVFLPETIISPDSPRYINMGLNVANYGTISNQVYSPIKPPEPAIGMGGAFSAYEIATASLLDDATHQSLVCVVTSKIPTACPIDITALKVIYMLEIFIFHTAVFFIGRLIFGNDVKAFLAMGLSLAFEDTKDYANTILSEPAYMMAAALFLLFWVYAWKNSDCWIAWFVCGVALGLTILVKPVWAALLPGLGGVVLFSILWARDTHALTFRSYASLALGCILALSPLLVRNIMQLDHWGLSDPYYLGVSLAHRLAYNAMTWSEWAKGWIYYLPDFGDKAAHALFGEDAVKRLSWGTESYYVQGRDVLHQEAIAATSPQRAGRYLLNNNFFDAPVKGAAVTALLFWRGIFVGNLMGMVGLILAGPVLYFVSSRDRRIIVFLFLPVLMMAGVYALVSVSIHRYNIPLIIPYALIIAQFLYALGMMIGKFLPRGFSAAAKIFLPKNG